VRGVFKLRKAEQFIPEQTWLFGKLVLLIVGVKTHGERGLVTSCEHVFENLGAAADTRAAQSMGEFRCWNSLR
jgi:hypothetical protein